VLKNKTLGNNTIKTLIKCSLAPVLLFLLTVPINAVESSPEEDTLLFLGNEKLAPIVYQENGVAKGIAVDIAKAIGEKIGRRIEVEATNWDKAQERVLSGEADGLLQINSTLEREIIYDFSAELLKSEFSIFRGRDNISINSIYDLRGKNVGIESGGYPYHLLQNFGGVEIVIILNWAAGFEMINSGELDAVVVDRWIGEYELAKSRTRGIQVVDNPIESLYSRIAVKEGNTELLNLINAGLEEIKNDGTMAQILNRWSGKNIVYITEEGLRKTVVYTVGGILLLILLGALFIITRLQKMNRQLEAKVQERTRELHEANEQLKQISTIDGLTNILNRRSFDELYEKTWKMSLREKQPLSVIILDIDHFKEYNDTYGHLVGDQILKTVAGILRDAAQRPADLVARFGGEEFVVVLFNTTEDGAVRFAEGTRGKIENSVINYDGKHTSITASLGVATMVPHGDVRPAELIELADQAMYQAKKEGRNRVNKTSLLVKRLP